MSKSILKCGGATFALVIGSVSAANAQEPVQPGGDVFTPQNVQGNFGDLDAFHGDLDAFWGDLDAFWGDLDAFYGDLDAFWGDLDAFWGDLDAFWGDLDAFWGDLDAFWGDLDAFYGDLDAFWGDLDAFYDADGAFVGDRDALETALRKVFDTAKDGFGDVVLAKTGRNFNREVRNRLFQKYGITTKYDGIENLSAREYASLLMELNDLLATYTGLDHVDHWMASVNWTPELSAQYGNGSGVVVGLLDTPITNGGTIGGSVNSLGGFGQSVVDHGAGVASVLAGDHDGQGVMGVAPAVDFLVYNPFDETFTAGWDDVGLGVQALVTQNDASIINMSLGVEGYVLNPEWSSVFNDRNTFWGVYDTLIVKSAGNSGVSQTEDVDFWMNAAPNNIIVVGSVDAAGNISSFSNRPGTACLISWFACRDGNRLMDRFLVAPGENILVQGSDGTLSRVSGTSVAAPLVSGAAALVQSQWPWLKNNPVAISDILLETATDLGAPGVDEVYGRGLLNIEAAMQPIDSNALYIELPDGNYSVNALGGLTSEVMALVGDSATVTAFEDLAFKSRRDFEIPLSDLNLDTVAEGPQHEESYLASFFGSTSSPTGSSYSSYDVDGDDFTARDFSFTDARSRTTRVVGSENASWLGQFSVHSLDRTEVRAAAALQFGVRGSFVHQQSGLSLDIGQGVGAVAFSEGTDFGMITDHGRATGGVNPLLGLASGGPFVGAAAPLSDKMTLSFGYTESTRSNGFIDNFSSELRAERNGLADYEAAAVNIQADYALTNRVGIRGAFTRLNEDTGMLGGQGTGLLNLSGGAVTDAMTLQTTSVFPRQMSLSLSATSAQTQTAAFTDSILAIGDDGVTSTAFQLTGSKRGVFHERDRLRLSVGQPLHVETGEISITASEIVDRETGEAGFVTQGVNLNDTPRRMVSELRYGTPLLDGAAELSALGAIDFNNVDYGEPETVVSTGLKLRIQF